MNKLLIAVIQTTLLAATLSATCVHAAGRLEVPMETGNQMCVTIDDKLVCAPMGDIN